MEQEIRTYIERYKNKEYQVFEIYVGEECIACIKLSTEYKGCIWDIIDRIYEEIPIIYDTMYLKKKKGI